jgi:predicted nuclease of restriction endonuclease-like RecB superfamily
MAMLSPDLVHARRQKDELVLVPLGKRREVALELAETVSSIARDHVGRTREELDDAWSAISAEPRDRKLLDGIVKLVEDRISFESDLDGDPIALREEVFRRATELRRSDAPFDRAAVLAPTAAARGVDPAAIERALYADLKNAHVLRDASGAIARAIVEQFDLAQIQAVLLRATRVVATLEAVDPGALRALFRKLKFLRLLHSVHDLGSGRWRIDIDGPFSLFESVTKYGLALALSLPALAACGRHRIEADVRWGKERLPLRFVSEGVSRGDDRVPARLSEETEALRARIAERPGWKVEVADTIIDLAGVGACVPDLLVTHRASRKKAFVEVMGYWSRDAVWKRVELAQSGMKVPVLFCVSERLRVSEAVLPDDAPGALLVYKGVIPISALETKLARLLRLPT